MADTREDIGEFYPGGEVVPKRPIKADNNYITVGADQYIKSEIVDGVQHYTKLAMVNHAELGWTLTTDGDYILVDGEFVAAE